MSDRPAQRTTKAAKPVPASIPMPDSAIRQHWAWQLYVRMSRPTLDWVGVFAAYWSLGGSDIAGKAMPEGTRIIVLGFIAALYGVRTFEKAKGVA